MPPRRPACSPPLAPAREMAHPPVMAACSAACAGVRDLKELRDFRLFPMQKIPVGAEFLFVETMKK